MPDGFDIVDDSEARQSCTEWSYEQLAMGRTPEDVEAELLQGGWPADDAAGIVEQARQRSRHLRGTVTRADAAIATGIGNPSVTSASIGRAGRGTAGGFGGVIGALFALVNVVGAVSRLWTTKPKSKR